MIFFRNYPKNVIDTARRTAVIALLALLTPLAAYAQDEAAEPDPSILSEEDRQRLDARLEELETLKEDLRRMENLRDGREGFAAELMDTRIDSAWIALFDATIKLARDVIKRRDAGQDVSGYLEKVTAELRAKPGEAQEAMNRVFDRVVFPGGDATPDEIVIVDQNLLRSIQDLDALYAALITYDRIAAEIGIDTTGDEVDLGRSLTDSASGRSVFLQMATDEVAVLRSAVAVLPGEKVLADRLKAAEARVQIAARVLANALDLMAELDLESDRYRQQVVKATGEVTAEVLDVGVFAGLIADWTQSFFTFIAAEGPGFVWRLLLVALIVLVFSRLAKWTQKLVRRGLSSQKVRLSSLLQNMIVSSVKNVVIILGIMIALTQLGISLGPLLAGLGIAGFIVGFALQDTLGNFASGMMILIYRPFDVGDFVDAGGVMGTVSHMSLVNTTFMTIDNKKLIVPNNAIWGAVITNFTAQKTRRVDLVFGVSYGDDLKKVEQVLTDIVAEHDAVLDDPEPVIKVHELGDSSVNFIVRPWVKTEDYWGTYWDLMKTVKLRFDEEGVTIPFPQRDVHVIETKPA